jgi:hypothetical protein
VVEPSGDLVQYPNKGCCERRRMEIIRSIGFPIDVVVETYNKTRAKPFEWTYTGQPLKI